MPVPALEEPLSLGRLGDSIGFRLRRIQNSLSGAFTAESVALGLRPAEFSALAVIAANPGLSQGMLAREVGLDKSAAVAVIDDLERLHLAKRRRLRADRRRVGSDDLQVLSNLLDRIHHSCFRQGG